MNPSSCYRLAAWLFILCLLSPVHAWSRPFRICLEDWPPHAFVAVTSVTGPSVDIYREALANLGIHTVEFLPISYNRCSEEVRLGTMDMKLFVLANELPDLPTTREPTEYWLLAAIVHRDAPWQRFTGLETFRSSLVGTVEGYVYPEALARFIAPRARMTFSPVQAYRQLENRRVDVVFLDLVDFETRNRALGLPLRALRPLVNAQPLYAALARPHAALAPRLSRVLRAMRRSGRFDTLYRQHTGLGFGEWRQQAELAEGSR